jgi:hypothetical protein
MNLSFEKILYYIIYPIQLGVIFLLWWAISSYKWWLVYLLFFLMFKRATMPIKNNLNQTYNTCGNHMFSTHGANF